MQVHALETEPPHPLGLLGADPALNPGKAPVRAQSRLDLAARPAECAGELGRGAPRLLDAPRRDRDRFHLRRAREQDSAPVPDLAAQGTQAHPALVLARGALREPLGVERLELHGSRDEGGVTDQAEAREHDQSAALDSGDVAPRSPPLAAHSCPAPVGSLAGMIWPARG